MAGQTLGQASLSFEGDLLWLLNQVHTIVQWDSFGLIKKQK
jgi:hypothetical protein